MNNSCFSFFVFRSYTNTFFSFFFYNLWKCARKIEQLCLQMFLASVSSDFDDDEAAGTHDIFDNVEDFQERSDLNFESEQWSSVALRLWRQASDRNVWFRFQMLSKNHRVHAVYVLVKFVVPKIPWSVASSLPWVLSLEKNFSSLSETYPNWGGGRWMV